VCHVACMRCVVTEMNLHTQEELKENIQRHILEVTYEELLCVNI